MTRARKALALVVMATLGLWGCAQDQNPSTRTAKIKALESKYTKLEDDFRSVVAARDQMRKKLLAAEQEKNRLGEQLEEIKILARERDELKQQVNSRIGERDALQAQFDQFRKGIRSLLGQADSASNSTPGQPVTSATPKVKGLEKS